MFLKNLLRRKIRTALTILGIAIGVATIIALGALANGLESGYTSMLQGSKADFVLSQPDAWDISYSSVDEDWSDKILAAPEVKEVAPMLEGYTQTENEPYFFVFGYPTDCFMMRRFNLIEGDGLDSHAAQMSHGKPILLGSAAAEILKKSVGDSLRISGSVFRVIGVYQTGDAFEDSGAVMSLKDAQEMLGRQRQVSLIYIRLKDPSLGERFLERAKRQWSDYDVSGAKEYAEKQSFSAALNAYVWAIGGLAIVIGGVGMMNAQLMAIMERTREIGVLRAVGWSRRRVLWMILMESFVVCLLGGILGLGIGYFLISMVSKSTVVLGVNTGNISPGLILQALIVVIVLGLVGGLYPAVRASRLEPVEALRYEGGSTGAKVRRLPVGGMSVQSLFQRSTRSLLTLAAISLTVGAIMAIDGVMNGMISEMGSIFKGMQVEIILRQANVADTSLSSIDERDAARIAAMPEVESTSGYVITGLILPDKGIFFIMQGYVPNDFPIQRFKIVEGNPLTTNHQILLGKTMAEAMNKKPGDTIELSGYRYSIIGIYETGIGWEEMGGVVTLRDAQTFSGRPRKSTMYAVKLKDPKQAEMMVEKINRDFPEIHASLSADFMSQMPDIQNSDAMMDAISFLAILVGGVGVLNAMLMSVFERTREIGVLRALGWRRRRILGLILQEAAILGALGGAASVGLAMLMVAALGRVQMMSGMINPIWTPDIFLRAILIALLLGIIGGLYPAFRATRLQPIEALRYE